MALRPIGDLGVAEAYEILADRLGQADIPPLEAIENEDWGRDYLLSRLQSLSKDELAALGLTTDDSPTAWPEPPDP